MFWRGIKSLPRSFIIEKSVLTIGGMATMFVCIPKDIITIETTDLTSKTEYLSKVAQHLLYSNNNLFNTFISVYWKCLDIT